MISVGLDEVGRGCLAGPMVVGAVILDQPIDGLKDSKLLTKLQRVTMLETIKTKAQAYSLGWVSSKEIDSLGLSASLRLAMERALSGLSQSYQEIIIDGSFNPLQHNPKARAIIKADQTIPAVSAASVLAKIARDNYMSYMSKTFPNYGFDSHVGYGTNRHLSSIKTYGPCHLHRFSFKPLLGLNG